MNYQKRTPKEVLAVFKKKDVKLFGIDYFAYPATFGSTAGPCGGIGGAAMSTFTVEAYVVNDYGPTVYVCSGMYYFDDNKFKFGSVKTNMPWIKL